MTPSSRPTFLHGFLHWEKTQPDAVYLTQPRADGGVADYTWKDVGDQARRVAAHLQSLHLPPQSNIALLGRNSAHWIISDLAIAMAGHVSVPMYPTLNGETAHYILEHSQARLLMLGRMDGVSDGWNEVQPVPIENKLGGHPSIEAVCVTGPGQPQPFALILLSPVTQAALTGARRGARNSRPRWPSSWSRSMPASRIMKSSTTSWS